jgi:arsenate reductase
MIPVVTHSAPEVLFVCVHNAGRSQMAAGLLQRKAGDRVRVLSAGSEPTDRLNPAVVEAMSEIGIDISAEQPKKLETDMVRRSDVVITMGCGDACPIFPGKRYEDWELEDPAGKDLETVRRIRAEISERVDRLTRSLTDPAAAG